MFPLSSLFFSLKIFKCSFYREKLISNQTNEETNLTGKKGMIELTFTFYFPIYFCTCPMKNQFVHHAICHVFYQPNKLPEDGEKRGVFCS